jgi:hypothetical protein
MYVNNSLETILKTFKINWIDVMRHRPSNLNPVQSLFYRHYRSSFIVQRWDTWKATRFWIYHLSAYQWSTNKKLKWFVLLNSNRVNIEWYYRSGFCFLVANEKLCFSFSSCFFLCCSFDAYGVTHEHIPLDRSHKKTWKPESFPLIPNSLHSSHLLGYSRLRRFSCSYDDTFILRPNQWTDIYSCKIFIWF